MVDRVKDITRKRLPNERLSVAAYLGILPTFSPIRDEKTIEAIDHGPKYYRPKEVFPSQNLASDSTAI